LVSVLSILFVSEPESKYKEINRTSVKEYRNKVRSIFKAINLQWDLADWKEYLSQIGHLIRMSICCGCLNLTSS